MVSDAERGDLDAGLLAAYAEAVKHPDPDRLLRARGLIDRSGQLTVACVLLFADHPQSWLPEASVRILRYQGTERGSGARHVKRQRQLLRDAVVAPVHAQLLMRSTMIRYPDIDPRRSHLAQKNFHGNAPQPPSGSVSQG